MWALPLLLLVAGCGASQERYVRPWFRLVTSPEHVIAPHAIEWGGARRAEVLVEGEWHELPHQGRERGDFSVHPVGDAVAIDEYTFTTSRHDPMNDPRDRAASGVFVYHRGYLAPIHIPPSKCASPEYTEKPAEITCFGCGAVEPYLRVHPAGRREEACGTMHVDTYDTFGRLVARRAFPSPAVEPDVEGRLPTGEWIVAETKRRTDFLYFGAPKMRFRLGADGFTPLPFGANPLSKEIDAERRAQEIVREEPVRDAAVASLRSALLEDERAHPGWIVESELVNRLRKGSALEPQVPARPGNCYTIIARASPELTQMAISVRRDWSDLARSIAHTEDPPLARSVGAPVVTTSHCVGAGEPPLLRFRIEAAAGTGYVVARIYVHPKIGRSP